LSAVRGFAGNGLEEGVAGHPVRLRGAMQIGDSPVEILLADEPAGNRGDPDTLDHGGKEKPGQSEYRYYSRRMLSDPNGTYLSTTD
jgi:hypothetical protein